MRNKVGNAYRRLTPFLNFIINPWKHCDIHLLNNLSGQKALRYVVYEIMQTSGLMNTFQITSSLLFGWAEKLEDLYNKKQNPYHNALHAADVVQTLHYLIQQNSVVVSLKRFQQLSVEKMIFFTLVWHKSSNQAKFIVAKPEKI